MASLRLFLLTILFLLGSLLCSQPEVASVEGLGICNLLALICGLVGFVVNHREHTTKRQGVAHEAPDYDAILGH